MPRSNRSRSTIFPGSIVLRDGSQIGPLPPSQAAVANCPGSKIVGRPWELVLTVAPATETVDYLLVGSAIARARWELDYVRGWERNPWFYLDQTLASVFVSLTQPPPFDQARSAEVVRRLQAIPQIISDGESEPERPGRTAGTVIDPAAEGHSSPAGRNGTRPKALSTQCKRRPA